MRDVLLTLQIAICAVLVTSSLVAVRGLERSLHGNFGIDPRHVLLVDTDLATSGYTPDRMPAMQQRMADAVRTIPGVATVGVVAQTPPMHLGWNDSKVFGDDVADLRPGNAAADAIRYSVSPDYFQAAGTALLAGRAFTIHDDQHAPRVAVVNQTFARKVFGTPDRALGHFFKLPDGARIEVVGVAEDGKYTANLTEDPQPAMFFPLLQAPSSETWLVIRSASDAEQLSAAVRATLHALDPGLPASIETWTRDMDGALFAPRVAAVCVGPARCHGRNCRHHGDLRHRRVFAQQTPQGARDSHGVRRRPPRGHRGGGRPRVSLARGGLARGPGPRAPREPRARLDRV